MQMQTLRCGGWCVEGVRDACRLVFLDMCEKEDEEEEEQKE